jgi:uncharacterized Zn-finger protein
MEKCPKNINDIITDGLSFSKRREKPFQCSICLICFTRKYNLQRHMIDKHAEEKDRQEAEVKIVQTIKCLHCHENFLSKPSLKIHLRKKHINKIENSVKNITRYKCSICKFTFSKMFNLDHHCYKHHPIKVVP